MTDTDESHPGEIGPYTVVDVLGRGGMGIVYRAHDPTLRRDVAVKVLLKEHASIDERRQRFLREARTAAQLSHPNIAVVHAVGDSEVGPWIAMELVSGATWRDLRARGRLPALESLISQALKVARALEYAHECGVVHRDLKPDNIIIDDKGRARVLDFGLAKAFAVDATAATQTFETAEGRLMGTPGYMSPEQIEGQRVDASTDVFAFAASLYEMLCDRQAFEGGSAAAVLVKTMHEDPTPLRDIDATLPSALCALVERGLAKLAEKRPPDMNEFVTLLQKMERAAVEGRIDTLDAAGNDAEAVASTIELSDVAGPSARTSESQAGLDPNLAGTLVTGTREATRARRRRGILVAALVSALALTIVVAMSGKGQSEDDGPLGEPSPPIALTDDSATPIQDPPAFEALPAGRQPAQAGEFIRMEWGPGGDSFAVLHDDAVHIHSTADDDVVVLKPPDAIESLHRIGWTAPDGDPWVWCVVDGRDQTYSIDVQTQEWTELSWMHGHGYVAPGGSRAIVEREDEWYIADQAVGHLSELVVDQEIRGMRGWSPSGRLIALGTVREDANGFGALVYDVEAHEVVHTIDPRLIAQPYLAGHAIVFVDDEHILVSGTDSPFVRRHQLPSQWRLVRIADGAMLGAVSEPFQGGIGTARLVRDGDAWTLWALVIRMRPVVAVAEADNADGVPRVGAFETLSEQGQPHAAKFWLDDETVLIRGGRVAEGTEEGESRIVVINAVSGETLARTPWEPGFSIDRCGDEVLRWRTELTDEDGISRLTVERMELDGETLTFVPQSTLTLDPMAGITLDGDECDDLTDYQHCAGSTTWLNVAHACNQTAVTVAHSAGGAAEGEVLLFSDEETNYPQLTTSDDGSQWVFASSSTVRSGTTDSPEIVWTVDTEMTLIQSVQWTSNPPGVFLTGWRGCEEGRNCLLWISPDGGAPQAVAGGDDWFSTVVLNHTGSRAARYELQSDRSLEFVALDGAQLESVMAR